MTNLVPDGGSSPARKFACKPRSLVLFYSLPVPEYSQAISTPLGRRSNPFDLVVGRGPIQDNQGRPKALQRLGNLHRLEHLEREK